MWMCVGARWLGHLFLSLSMLGALWTVVVEEEEEEGHLAAGVESVQLPPH